jgi:glutathione S-transferase
MNGKIAMTPTITAFVHSPDRGGGLARDMRVRWALEEVAQPYEVRLVSFGAMKEPAHRALHPFGQIPTYEEGDLALFESGAIVFHIAEQDAGLLPDDANARARAITWMFAALSTVEPPILDLQSVKFLEGDKSWDEQRLPLVENRIRDRLRELSARLGDSDWLDGAFSAGDLMMVAVLFRLKASGLLNDYPNLSAYVARGRRHRASSARLGRIDLIDRKVPVVGRELPTTIFLVLASRRVGEQGVCNFLLMPGTFHVPIRDLHAIVPARRLVGMKLRMIDPVVENVPERLFLVENRDLVLAEEIPPLIDEAVSDAVDPLDLITLDAWLGGLAPGGSAA